MIDEAMTEVGSPELHEQARSVYRQSVEAELPLTGAELGGMFSRSDRWGRARIAEVKAEAGGAEVKAAEALSVPVEVPEEVAEVLPISGSARGIPQLSEAVEPEDEEREWEPGEQEEWEANRRKASALVAAVNLPRDFRPAELPQRRGARAVSWVSFVFGVVVSVAANVAHTFHPSSAQLEAWQAAGHLVTDWSPEVGSMIAAAFWPIALLLAVEVLTRVRWRRGFLWNAARFGGTGAVALVAALMSYRHMAGLLASYGEDWLSAHAGPLAVDGLMIVAGFALLSMGSKSEDK